MPSQYLQLWRSVLVPNWDVLWLTRWTFHVLLRNALFSYVSSNVIIRVLNISHSKEDKMYVSEIYPFMGTHIIVYPMCKLKIEILQKSYFCQGSILCNKNVYNLFYNAFLSHTVVPSFDKIEIYRHFYVFTSAHNWEKPQVTLHLRSSKMN
jgi:hypothetical protein